MSMILDCRIEILRDNDRASGCPKNADIADSEIGFYSLNLLKLFHYKADV